MGSCEKPCCWHATAGVERCWRSFFIKIRACTIEDKKLNLPLKFARKYGDELSDVAKLTVPNGLIWEVSLTKGETVWLDKGWHEFVEYYGVCNGWLLLFNYMGMSNFNVSIFDESVFEIGYPCIEPSHVRKQLNEDQMNDDDFVVKFGSTPPPSSNKGASSKKRDYTTSQQNLTKRVSGSSHLGITKRFKNSASAEKRKFQQECQRKGKICKMDQDFVANDDSNQDGTDMSSKWEAKIFTSNRFYVTLAKVSPESKRAADAALNCTPKNPAFLVILCKNYMRSNALHVPSAFAKKFLQNISEIIKVQDSFGGEWIIHTSCCRRGWSLILNGGWADFFSDNDLQEGDVCLFELIQTEDVVLKVLLFHEGLE